MHKAFLKNCDFLRGVVRLRDTHAGVGRSPLLATLALVVLSLSALVPLIVLTGILLLLLSH